LGRGFWGVPLFLREAGLPPGAGKNDPLYMRRDREHVAVGGRPILVGQTEGKRFRIRTPTSRMPAVRRSKESSELDCARKKKKRPKSFMTQDFGRAKQTGPRCFVARPPGDGNQGRPRFRFLTSRGTGRGVLLYSSPNFAPGPRGILTSFRDGGFRIEQATAPKPSGFPGKRFKFA